MRFLSINLKKMSKNLSRADLNDWLQRATRTWKEGHRILWIGAGGDLFENIPSKHRDNIVTIDIDRNRDPDIVMSAEALGFKESVFDIVLCLEVLEHVKNPTAAMSQLHRVLKKDGLLYLSTPFICGIHDAPHDYYRYTEYGLRYLAASYKTIDLKNRGGPLVTLAIISSRLIFSTNKCEKSLGVISTLIGTLLRPMLHRLDEIMDSNLTYGYTVIAKK